MPEATVAVNFVADVQNAMAGVSSLEGAIGKLATAGMALSAVGATLFLGNKVYKSMQGIVDAGSNAESQVMRLKAAFQAVPGVVDPAAMAMREYDKAVVFAAKTPFDVDQSINSAIALRSMGVDPLVESYKRLTIAGPKMANALTILGDIAALTKQPMQEMIDVYRRATAGLALDDLARRINVSFPVLKAQMKGLVPSTKEYNDKLMMVLGNLKQFQGGMEFLSATIPGITSNIKDAGAQFITSLADFKNAGGLYATVRDNLKSLSEWLGKNSEEITFFAKVAGMYLAQFFQVVKTVLSPVISIFEMLGNSIVSAKRIYIDNIDAMTQKLVESGSFQQKMSIASASAILQPFKRNMGPLLGLINTQKNILMESMQTTEQKARQTANLLESIQLYLALIFGYVRIKIEAFYEGVKKVLDFLGLDFNTVVTMISILLGMKFVSAVYSATMAMIAFGKANARIMIGKFGLLMLVYALAQLIENWDSFSVAAKAGAIALGVVGAALMVYSNWVGIAAAITKVLAVAELLAFGWVAAIILAVVAAVSLLVGGIYLLIKNWDAVAEAFGNGWEWIKEKFLGFIDWLVEWGGNFIDAMVQPFKDAYDEIKGVLGPLWDYLFGDSKNKEIKVTGTVSSSGAPSVSGNKADGGSVLAGKSYRVGENGPEILTMGNMGGSITSNKGAGNSIFNVSISVDASGAKEPRAVGEAVASSLENKMSEMMRRFAYS